MRRLFTRLVAGLARRRATAGDGALALFQAGRAAVVTAGSRDAVDISGLFLCGLSVCDSDDVIGE